ncbi:MAG: hypothetical protein GY835_23445 [bacterium]|nr:hypothetical protein [bacterium]
MSEAAKDTTKSFTVTPQKADVKSLRIDRFVATVIFVGIPGSVILAAVISFLYDVFFGHFDDVGAADTVAIIAFCIAAPSVFIFLLWTFRSNVKAYNETQIEKVRNAARSAADSANKLIEETQAKWASLPGLIEEASENLAIAEQEFSESAYLPFWHRIRATTILLGRFTSTTAEIVGHQRDYEKTLNKYEHTFPSAIPLDGELPDISNTMVKLRTVERKGLTDRNFTNTLSHMNTQSVLIKGFGSLHTALDNIAGQLSASLADMTEELAESNIELRRSIESRIDDLEHSLVKRT